MLHITIQDNNTNEVIYDGDVSMIIMQGVEKNGIRSIKHRTEDAGVGDMIRCVKSAIDEAAEAKQILLNVLEQAIDRIDFDELIE